MNMHLALAALVLSTFASSAAHAAILFEGWSKVLISGQHVGYVVQRYEFDEKKKEFRATHFLKTSAEAGGLSESLAAKADSAFKPITYQYTSVSNGKPTTIDANFKGGKIIASVVEGKEKKTITNTLPKGAFLSAFLGYVMLQGKEGLKKGVKYEYQGVLEESATIAKGEAFISAEENIDGIPGFRVLNTINGSKFISLVSHKAEVLGTVSPTQGVQTVLVATMSEAVGGFGVNNSALTQLFGSMPTGKDNEIARRASKPKAPTPTTTTAPAGKGFSVTPTSSGAPTSSASPAASPAAVPAAPATEPPKGK